MYREGAPLTKREKQVKELRDKGFSNEYVADELDIRIRSVQKHITQINAKRITHE